MTDLSHKIADAAPMRIPALVFEPGHKMMVGQLKVPVAGTAECPASDKTMELTSGASSDESKFSCIVISHDTKEVVVSVGLPQGVSREVWSVERIGERSRERVMLRRADGSYIANAE